MSEHTRKHPTDSSASNRLLYVKNKGVLYAIPMKIAKRYVIEVSEATEKKGNIAADEVFRELDCKYGKAGTLLKGLRARENMTQVEFAKKIGISQENLSKMENGKRVIGKIIAKRIAKIFSVNPSYFSEKNE